MQTLSPPGEGLGFGAGVNRIEQGSIIVRALLVADGFGVCPV